MIAGMLRTVLVCMVCLFVGLTSGVAGEGERQSDEGSKATPSIPRNGNGAKPLLAEENAVGSPVEGARPQENGTGSDARSRLVTKEVVDKLLAEAKGLYHQDLWDECVAVCDKVLVLDPASLKAQELKNRAERAKIERAMRMLDQKSRTRDDEAIAAVDEASMFPGSKPPLHRPVRPLPVRPLPLRQNTLVKSEKMLAMEQKLNYRVDLNLMDVDLGFLLSTLHRISGVNIIADDESLEGKKLKILVEDMPLREILKFIVRKYSDIAYTVTEEAVWITKKDGDHPGMEPRVHPINLPLTVTSPQKENRRSTTQPGRQPTRGGRPILPGVAPGGNEEDEEAAQEIKTSLDEMIEWMEQWPDWPAGSKTAIDKTTSSLLAYTTPEIHEKIAQMLEMVDRPPIQVLISTRFITISIDDLADLGLDFSMNTKPGQDIVLGVGSGTDLGVNAGTGLSAIVQGQDTDPLFTVTLRALQQKGRAKVLSAPQVITLNNQRGLIDLSTTFRYQSDWQEITTRDVVGDNSGNIIERISQFKPVMTDGDIGFRLLVTPSVGRDLKHIVLELEPVVSDVVGGTTQFTETQFITVREDEAPPPVPQPVFVDQRVLTRVVVEDGAQVIMGGLLTQDTTRTTTKVPVLGDIPLLGLLFRRQNDTVSKSHLVIVVKAQIVDPSGKTYSDAADIASGGAQGARKKEPYEGPWLSYPDPLDPIRQ
jgi:hypothetical protein